MNDTIERIEYAIDILGKIPAFGDTIGAEVSKAQLGVAHNKLKLALESIKGEIEPPFAESGYPL